MNISHEPTVSPLQVLIAGAGVAGLEAALALDALAGEAVAVTLLDPAEHFEYRPMAVAEPFSLGHARAIHCGRWRHEPTRATSGRAWPGSSPTATS
jgi:2-polyprenyl-6-methoxyphenol hydroxylase-like FAD-dependent oxidoreductase